MSRLIIMFVCTIFVQMNYCQNLEFGTCSVIGKPHLNIQKDGRGKARDHCIDWIELNYPCVSSQRIDECHISKPTPGRDLKNIYPHNVLFGYTSDNKEVIWLCSGTLISDQWVLASAHCPWYRNHGNVTKARMAINIDNQQPNHDYDIVEIHNHPKFKSRKSYYNDIALIKLNKRIELSSEVVPACLDYEGLKPNKGIETGFLNSIDYDRVTMYEIPLNSLDITECSKMFLPSWKLRTGINDTTQICYKNTGQNEDMCGGYIDGIIQVLNENVYCTYTVFGIQSFGRACRSELPLVYTRVKPYLEWIEEMVWP